MKKATPLTLFFVLASACFNFSKAQNELFGEWEVFCPTEIYDNKAKFCDICEYERTPVTAGGVTVYGFDAIVKKDSLVIKNSKGISTVKYDWDKATKTMTFKFNKKDYSFVLLGTENPESLVMKNKDALLTTWAKRKPTK